MCRLRAGIVLTPVGSRTVASLFLTDAVTGEQQVVATGLPEPSVMAFDNLQISPDCAYVTWFTTTDGGTTFTFSAWDASATRDTPVFSVEPISPYVVEWSPDMRYLLLRRSLVADVLVNVPSGNVMATIENPNRPRLVEWVVPQGKLLVARSGNDHVLEVLNLNGRVVGSVDVGIQNIHGVDANASGTTFAIYNGYDNPIYDLASLTMLGQFWRARLVDFMTDTLVYGGRDRYYDLVMGRVTYWPEHVRNFNPANHTREGNHPYVLLSDTAYEVYVGNLDTGSVTRLKLFAPLLEDSLALFRRTATYEDFYVSGRCHSFVQAHQFDLSQNRVLVVPNATCHHAIAEFDLATGEPVFVYNPPLESPIRGTTVNFVLSPDGAWLAAYEILGSLRNVWVTRRGTNDWVNVSVFGDKPSAYVGRGQFAFSLDGTLFAHGSEEITVYNVTAGSMVTTFDGPAALVRSLRFIDNGTLEVVNHYDGGVQTWDIVSGTRLDTTP